MARCLHIGLTGGIASGKTTVAERFVELGVPVIDADDVARAVVAPGEPGLAEVTRAFGSGVLTADGQLDRRALRNLVFSNPAQRKVLEGILHPRIQGEMARRAAAVTAPYVIMVIPLLVEGGKLDRFDRILVIDVDEELQIQRVMARDSSTREQAHAILAAQATRAARLAAADDVLKNTGPVSDLRQAVDALHERYLRLAAAASASKDDFT
jgi:dephospho-CoA kinase